MIAGLLRGHNAQFARFVSADVRTVAAAGVGNIGIIVPGLSTLVVGETKAFAFIIGWTTDAQCQRLGRAAVVGQWAEHGVDVELIAGGAEADAAGGVADQIIALSGNRSRTENIRANARAVDSIGRATESTGAA